MIRDAVAFLGPRAARVAVVLGSGLGAFADELTERIEIPYSEIPGWPSSTATGHAGKLVFGKLGTQDLAVMAGRVHLYEGYTPAQVTFGVRVLGSLGVRSMVFTNAADGINTQVAHCGEMLDQIIERQFFANAQDDTGLSDLLGSDQAAEK